MKLLMGLLILISFQQAFAMDAGYTVKTTHIDRGEDDTLDIITLDGALNKGVAADVIDALKAAHADTIYLELNSPGGYQLEAQQIYDFIKEEKQNGLKISTFVASGSICASACTIIFLAAETRVAGAASSFMVHGVQRESMPGFLDKMQTSGVLKLYVDNGVSNDWILTLKQQLVFSGVNDFWFTGTDAASKSIGFATVLNSGLIVHDPPPFDPQIHAR